MISSTSTSQFDMTVMIWVTLVNLTVSGRILFYQMQIMVLRLLKPYCLRRLMYGCEIWPLNAVNVREIDVLWNNGFRHVFNCCWQESVRPMPLQFYCHSLPLSYQLHERQLLFYR